MTDETLLDEILADEDFERIRVPEDEHGLTILYKAPFCSKGQVPAIVWIHGGGWKGSDASVMKPHMSYFARLGAASFSVEYRLAVNGNEIEDCLADCKSAMRYIRANAASYGIDPNHLIVIGESAGGHLACCLSSPRLCRKEELADYVVSVNGVIDLTMKWKKSMYSEDIIARTDVPDWIARYEREYAISPIFHITKDNAPILFYHGLLDRVVEPEESMRYHYLLREAGVKTDIRLLPDVTHAFLLFHYNTPHERVWRALKELAQFIKENGYL